MNPTSVKGITRRFFAGAMAGATVGAKDVVQAAAKSLEHSDKIAGIATAYEHPRDVQPKITARNKFMSHDEAAKLAYGSPALREEVRQYLRECAKNEVIICFEPDIANKKSWSHAYKCLVQRDRLIERALEQELSNFLATKPGLVHPIGRFIHKLMFGSDQ